jgi:hypothetical protein
LCDSRSLCVAAIVIAGGRTRPLLTISTGSFEEAKREHFSR